MKAGQCYQEENRVHAMVWINFKSVTLSERRQTQKPTHNQPTPFIWHSGKGNTTAVENESVISRGWDWVVVRLPVRFRRELSGGKEMFCTLTGSDLHGWMCLPHSLNHILKIDKKCIM